MALLLPPVIGHRGACAYAPENTIESIEAAAGMGTQWVELDVKLTRDNVPIVFHDETLERTTNGSGAVMHTDYADIQALEAGSWFADAFSGIKIPTLEEAVDILLKHNLGLNLEIKPCPGREKETAEVVLDHLSQMWDDREKLLVSSFQHVSLEVARDMAPDWTRGLLIGGDFMPENWEQVANYLEADTMNLGTRFVTRQVVEDVIDTGRQVLVYTVNQPDEAKKYQQWGVDSVFSDNPDLILEGAGRKLH